MSLEFLWYIPNTVEAGHHGDDEANKWTSLDLSAELAQSAETQAMRSNYVSVTGGSGQYRSIPFRYVWPAELTSWPSSPASGCVIAGTGGRGNRSPARAASTSRSGRSLRASVPQAETRSQTKMSVSPGAITLPAPRVP